MTRAALNDIILGTTTFEQQTAGGNVKLEGDGAKLGEFVSLLDAFELWFNIVTPDPTAEKAGG
jgi:alkyl sulfatase BDS1-like metallo-beta-lactamase superfamily hydrolase